MKTFILLAAISLFLFSCSDNLASYESLTFNEKLQYAMDAAIRDYNGKGISAALIMPNGDTWMGASGTSDGINPVTTNMLFSAGSITKTFTAHTILQLADEGVLSLDDSLHTWLPAYPNIDSTITIRQLLNHTNGIFNLTENQDIWTEVFADPDRQWTMDEAISYTQEPYFPKGTSWHYSNTGYLLLRKIIKIATISGIDAAYRSRLIGPADLENTYLAPMENLPGPQVQPWMDLDGNGTYDQLPFMTSFYSMAGGGIFCTPMDLAKWAKAVFIDQELISPSSYEQMMTLHSPCPGEDLVSGYGLGVCLFNPALFNGHTVYGHGGDAIGYAAACMYLAEYGVCLAVMDNTQAGENMWVINDLIEVIVNQLEGQ